MSVFRSQLAQLLFLPKWILLQEPFLSRWPLLHRYLDHLVFLFQEGHFDGFRVHDEVDYETRILQNYKFMRRGDAEHDSSKKQPIAYALVVNPSLKEVFAYQRSKQDDEYPESIPEIYRRLFGYTCFNWEED